MTAYERRIEAEAAAFAESFRETKLEEKYLQGWCEGAKHAWMEGYSHGRRARQILFCIVAVETSLLLGLAIVLFSR